MKKEYWIILIVYIAMQLSSIVGLPLMVFGSELITGTRMDQGTAVSSWLVISFSLALIIILFLLRKDMKVERSLSEQSSVVKSIAWAIGGVFLALIAQSVAANIEYMIGIEMGSENTQQIMSIIETSSIVILVVSIIGPILEEIIFRKIIFGSLHKRFNFFISALLSSVIFAAAHTEFEHLLLYSAMGFTFAFLYVKTKRILVPIFAHVAMNSLVVVMQLNMEEIEKWLEEMEHVAAFIGGLL
ncbi:CPBP family intramembrane glutamic endopeptidase [Bacillus mesophilum]|uniref:CPBP family intramembrane metalloprotease n=1 Tax=Bacillus mesophilum TaxID=1071718 RepID=A0A7V7UTA0_9BACI|nr:CPBP family intramembrane glutamic endopeptidase [Bacillus mesophilum]KAB2330025.1 CPBP family intramembrane metalloprotease [Bacillus mesophilum]